MIVYACLHTEFMEKNQRVWEKVEWIKMQITKKGAVVAETKSATAPVVEHKVSAQAKVRYGAGVTLNVGNYQSVRYDVSLELPCEAGEADAMYGFADKWVDEKLSKKIDEAKEAYGIQ